MSWIKEVNKIGKYDKTYEGFRIYCTKESEIIETNFVKEGKEFTRTEITKGEYVAIDKTGLRYDGDFWVIVQQIDKEIMIRKMSKRCGEELVWK